MTQLAAELAHDMRVPLTAIIASVEMLADDSPTTGSRGDALLNARCELPTGWSGCSTSTWGSQSRDRRPTGDVDLRARSSAAAARLGSSCWRPLGAVIRRATCPSYAPTPDDMYSVLQNLSPTR